MKLVTFDDGHGSIVAVNPDLVRCVRPLSNTSRQCVIYFDKDDVVGVDRPFQDVVTQLASAHTAN